MVKGNLLSKRVASLEESATLALNARVKQLKASGQPVFNLTAGELDGSTPGYIRRSVASKLDQNKYTPTAGLPALRQAIADYESERLKLDFTPDNVVVTAGVKAGLFSLLQVLLNPGDEVILPTPAWVSYNHMVNLAGGRSVKVPLTNSNDIDPDAIVSKLSTNTKLIIINSPHNPTGAVFSRPALSRLAESITTKPVFVVSDDIYSTLVFGQKFTSMANVGLPPEQLVVVNGFSKSQALTGWRIGYVMAPEQVTKVLTSFLSHASGNAPLQGQLAAEAALARGNKPTMFKTLATRRKLVDRELRKITDIKFNSPEGAFYFWLDLRRLTKDSASWCEQLLAETGVALVPGEAFFAPGFARLSFAADSTILKEALKRIKQFIEGPK